MAEVKYRSYRRYLEQRQMVNTGVMALLAGAQLASHTLQLTEGSDRTLREIFPKVEHIDRFNLKSELARQTLRNAEAHLAAMAIPYIISVHESLFADFESMLVRAERLPQRGARDNRSPVWVVRDHWSESGRQLEQQSWRLFEVLAEMRHDIIHRAGVAGDRLMAKVAALDADDQQLWTDMSKNSWPTFSLGARHQLHHADMIVALAVVKFIAQEGNAIIAGELPRTQWIDEFRDDVRDSIELKGNPQQRLRLLKAHARFYYAPLSFTEDELCSVL